MQKRLLFLVSLLLCLATTMMAQITTSGLSGNVKANGEDVIGATVEAIHVPTGTKYQAVTNTKGAFAINGMRPGGPYTVKVSYIGYESKEVKDITLQLGQTYNLPVSLSENAQELGEVVVSAKATKFTNLKTGAATNIDNTQMQNMPTVSRSLTDITRLSPYGGNGMSFGGMDGRTANFTVDGANFNNNFGLSSNLPGGGNPISIDAIQELQVVVAPFDVRQTNFISGGINAITKSGTNEFKGTAYVYHRNENMRGNSVYKTEIPGARETDRSTTYGGTFGGPIIKDKLFFFVQGEYITTPTQAVRWRASEDGVGNESQYLSYASIADMQRVQEFVREKYGYNTGSYTSFPADQSNTKLLGKLTWNITNQHHLDFRYNYTNNTSWMAPNASSMDGGTRSPYARTSLYSMAFANSMYSMHNKVHSFSLDLNSRFSNDLSNQFLATYSILNDERGSNSSEFPFIDIQDGTGQNVQYMSLGYELFTWNTAVHNKVWNIKDDLTWYKGDHKFLFGLNYEHQMADNQYMRNGTGYYRYASVDDFINGAAPEIVCLTYGYNGESKPAARINSNNFGLYAQDEWQAAKNFKLTYGFRLDLLAYDNGDLMTNNAIKALDYDGRHIDTGKWPDANLRFSPRVGFTWDVFGDNSLRFRGGTGLFAGRLPLVFFTNMPSNSGMVQMNAQLNATSKAPNYYTGPYTTDASGKRHIDMSQFAGGLVTDANGHATIDALKQKLISLGYPNTISPEDGTKPGSIAAVDKNFKMPQAWKSSLAVDYQMPVDFPFTVTLEGTFTKNINAATISDWSILPVEGFARWNGADNRPIFPTGFRADRTKAFVLDNTSKGYGWSFVAQVNMKPFDWMDFTASYTHTANKELTGMPGSNAESAFTYVPSVYGPNNLKLHNSQYVEPDRVAAGLNLHDKSGNHFSFFYEAWRGGYNYSYMIANDMNGDGYQYDALYIPRDNEVGVAGTAKQGEFRFATADDMTRFMDYVHKSNYLKNRQGEYAEAYSVYNPWVHRVDFSYKHDFKVNTGSISHKLQLSFDVKNVLNLFNSKWGVMKVMNPVLNEGRILRYDHTDAEGYPVFTTPSAVTGNVKTWTPNYAIGQCWYASIGLKYYFN